MVKYFVLVLLFFVLRTDYKRDFGEHKKAKIYHAIILGVLLFYYTGSSQFLFWFLGDFNNAIEYISKDVGIFSGIVMQIFIILHFFLSIFTLYIIYNLIKRRKEDLVRLKFVLPLLVITESLMLYKVVLESSDIGEVHEGISLLVVCIIIYGSFAIAIWSIYKKPFMKDFFNLKKMERIFPQASAH